MKRTVVAVGVMSVGVLFFTSGAHAAGIKEGKWSMTTAIHMDGMDDQAAEAMEAMENMSPEDRAMMQQMMGGMSIGGAGGGMGMSTTRTQCITPDNPVPESDDQENCRKTHTLNGDTVEFEVVCSDSRSTGQVTYKEDAMKGTITSTQTEGGQSQTVTLDISGQYVGPCD